GVCRWNDRGDHTAGRGDLDHAAVVGDDADRLQTFEIIPDVLGRETVLLALVLGLAKARFLVGYLSKPRCVGQRGLRHRFADGIDAGLVECGEDFKGTGGRVDRVTRFLLRYEVRVSHLFSVRSWLLAVKKTFRAFPRAFRSSSFWSSVSVSLPTANWLSTAD